MKILFTYMLYSFLAWCLAPGLAYPQTDHLRLTQDLNHSLGISLGLNDFHQKDKYLSPNIYNGALFASKLSYLVIDQKSRHAVDIFFSTGSISTELQPWETKQYVGYAAYSYNYAVDSWYMAGHPFDFFLGTGVSTFAAYTRIKAVEQISNDMFSDGTGYLSNSLDLHLRGQYLLSPQSKFSLQLTLPFARFVFRPENGHGLNAHNNEVGKNFLKAFTESKIEFFWNNLVLLSEFEFTQAVSERLDLKGTYWFGFLSSSRPLDMLSMGMYMNHFLLGLDWKF